MGEKIYDIKVRCYRFARDIVLFINKSDFSRLHVSIIDQLLRSGTSIGANVIEVKSGNSSKNLISFYSIALRSANETKYWLCLIGDTMSVNKTTVKELLKEADEISKIIAKSIITLKQNQKPPQKS